MLLQVSSAGRLRLALVLCLALTVSVLGQRPAGAATRVFSDDFEDGNSAGWTVLRGAWSVCQPAGQTRSYCVTAPTGVYPLTMAGSTAWTDYSVEASVYVTGVDGGAGIIGRAKDKNHFYLLQLKQFRKLWGWVLHRRDGDHWVDIAWGSYSWTAGRRYNLKLDFRGSTLTALISLDGGLTYTRLGGTTDATYASGRIGLRAWDTTAYFDNVRVTTP